MNIFKLLGFRKILFCFFKACLIMSFNIFFLLILIDEFISLPVLANIIWVKFIYFPLFYSILFYLFCFYLRKDFNNIDNLPKIKPLKKKRKFLEKFKNNYKESNKKYNIKKKILLLRKERSIKKSIISQKNKISFKNFLNFIFYYNVFSCDYIISWNLYLSTFYTFSLFFKWNNRKNINHFFCYTCFSYSIYLIFGR